MAKKLEEYTKEELIEAVKHLKKLKKFGLVWESKPEDVVEQCQKELPVLVRDDGKTISKLEEAPTNFLIEGDNYHALSVLNYTHTSKIDAIYIDPPYNTGAKDWKYNNRYVDSNDTYRHSKWLSFMDKRLRLAKSLLKPTGIIIVTIDDYEVATLTLLMDEIFGSENHLGTVVIKHNPSGRSTVKGFSVNHEYALFYSRTHRAKIGRLPHSQEQIGRYKEKDDIGYFEWENFRKNGTDSNRPDRPKQFYPLVINTRTQKLRVPKIKWNAEQKNYDLLEQISDSEDIVLPVNNGNEKVWKYGLERTASIIDEILVKKTSKGFELYRKKYLNDIGSLPRTWWDKPEYSARDNGTRALSDILGSQKVFDFPKAPKAVEDCIRVANVPEDGIVLDFFAGSGTTGQAVLNLNMQDGANRQFILCTNNENGIAENVTYMRIKKVIEGYKNIKGLPANMRYFKTAFVPKSTVSDDTRYELVTRSCDMICVREDTFDRVIDDKAYKIFRGSYHYTAILFDIDKLEDLKNKFAKLDDEPINIYVFSLTNDAYDEDFMDVSQRHSLCPIPESILEVYRKVFKEYAWN